jgi:hypothetical protein
MRASSGQQDSPFGWLTFGPAVLTGAGVLIYGVLNISYSLFYDRLGVSPEDVGLTYVTTLSRSTGFVALIAGVLAFGVLPLVVRNRALRRYKGLIEAESKEHEAYLRRHQVDAPKTLREEDIRAEVEQFRQRQYSELLPMLRRRSSLAANVVGGIAVALILLLTLSIPLFAIPRASQARSGREVSPIQVLGLTVLSVAANKATIQATGKPGETTAIDALRSRTLLYLGQAGGTLVFFDGVSKEAVLVPSSTAVVTVKS